MRRLTKTALVLSTVALAPLAVGEEKATPPPPELPKPAPALIDAFKPMTGTWACRGKAQKMDGTGELASRSTLVLKSALDGFAYSAEYQVEKNATLPNGMKGRNYWTYDVATEKLVEFFADSLGTVGRGTSDGLKGDTVVWDETGAMMGQPAKSRTTVKRIGPKEVTLTVEMFRDGKWVAIGSDACKKQ
jgi:Protein of unknown function (DUF1579)